ncbi:RloB family protein [Amycolatopsis sp., V23-08]|uniref:RloB family protein n=1 Tax=Amycolatopsis heterodermiae TaxID=3110235 RepID=A0ABU5QX58_9PSEU|nr:RloB family protein [Amycolatopsis sp., V23-08]MEA5358515.1 RloB family protein [Amycolatopsis sp., V23-08]
MGDHESEAVSKKQKRRRGSSDEERSLTLVRRPEHKQERVLYVGCEGESTEPDYLDYLVKRFGSGERTGQPFRIVPVCKANGLLPEQVVEAVRQYAAKDETWALFDRDEHTRIPQAVDDAAADGTEFCFSHPSFDLWLLLHFQAFGGQQSGKSTNVVDKLRKADPAFRRFDKKNDKSVQGPRRQALEGKTKAAIAHAKSLVSQCEHGACKVSHYQAAPVDRISPRNPDNLPQSPRKWAARSGHALDCKVLDRDPSTDVWRLLVSLGIEDD